MVGCKSRGSGTKIQKKGREKCGSVSDLPDRTCLDLETDLTWGRDIFYKTRLETTSTSPKPLTDKPYQVPTSSTDKHAGLGKYIESS